MFARFVQPTEKFGGSFIAQAYLVRRDPTIAGDTPFHNGWPMIITVSIVLAPEDVSFLLGRQNATTVLSTADGCSGYLAVTMAQSPVGAIVVCS